MDLTKLTALEFKKIHKLLSEKEKLTARIAEIDQALSGISTGETKRRARRSSTVQRGNLKEQVIEILKAAPEGTPSKEIATKIGVPVGNLAAWFSSTGKKILEIQKLGRGIYTWKEVAKQDSSASEAES